MPYATPEQLAAYPVAVPAGESAELLIRRASREIDRVLMTALYDPTDPDVVAALLAATCEQVAGNLDSGRTSTGAGTSLSVAGFGIGKVSVQQASASGVTPVARIDGLWPQAYLVLQQAGLTGGGPDVTEGVGGYWP